MVKLVASDLDGTIIDSKNSISPDNIQAINNIKSKNIPLVICTGKTYAISKEICKNLNASFGIFGNGSQIVNLNTGEEIMKNTLTSVEMDACFSVLKKYNLHIHAYTEDSIISPKLLYMDLRNSVLFPDKIHFDIVPSVQNYIKENNITVLKLVISSETSLSNIKEELEKVTSLNIMHISKTGIYKDNVINKEYEYLDISPINVSKGSALKILSSYLNVPKEDILSIGDNLNDIEMFRASNIGAALNNASDQVKTHATYITQNNVENGGFAEAIYKFISF